MPTGPLLGPELGEGIPPGPLTGLLPGLLTGDGPGVFDGLGPAGDLDGLGLGVCPLGPVGALLGLGMGVLLGLGDLPGVWPGTPPGTPDVAAASAKLYMALLNFGCV